jgi:hypothetical protein
MRAADCGASTDEALPPDEALPADEAASRNGGPPSAPDADAAEALSDVCPSEARPSDACSFDAHPSDAHPCDACSFDAHPSDAHPSDAAVELPAGGRSSSAELPR